MLNKKDKKFIWECIETEGFDYAFAHYSDFFTVHDEEFHKFRKAYLDARAELIKYIGPCPWDTDAEI